ncbi:MAG TPA: hypothetical protein VIX73_35385 [Kofleriaceae bacterium]|jgi:hypothetical protein
MIADEGERTGQANVQHRIGCVAWRPDGDVARHCVRLQRITVHVHGNSGAPGNICLASKSECDRKNRRASGGGAAPGCYAARSERA